jgi:hypothetical protein
MNLARKIKNWVWSRSTLVSYKKLSILEKSYW